MKEQENAQMFIIYMTRYNSDMTEGRGRMMDDIAFAHEQDAKDYIDTKTGIMGRKEKWSKTDYGDWDVKPIKVFRSLLSADEFKNEEIKQRALSKLSKEEKIALGLSYDIY